MYWGNSLLGIKDTISSLFDGLVEFMYDAKVAIWSIFYWIWVLLAKIVEGIEGVFRNLAGIGDTGVDMVSVIINNDMVQQIFGNLVGLSIALIVFFTIVKIIQEHYKDNNGGNPYKVVIRTFQGLLMFFFVSAAVSVGLYASQIMFKALDAATGTGSSSVAGQVFKNMAADANRKRRGAAATGLTSEVENKYYTRLSNKSDASNGLYFITSMTGNPISSSAQLAAAYEKAFPSLQYGIVNEDGSVTPIIKWLSAQGYSLGTQSQWDEGGEWEKLIENWKGKAGGYVNEFEEGSTSGTIGYQNDLLRGLDVEITPSISLTWSPIDIDVFGYCLKEMSKHEYDINIQVWGNGINISYGMQKGKFFSTGDKVEKSLEESAKVFGISANGKVGLQDGEASASWNLEMFDPSKFSQILSTIVGNIYFTNVFEQIIQAVPAFPMEVTVGPMAINLGQIFGMLFGQLLDYLSTCSLTLLLPKDENGKLLVEPISSGNYGHNGGVWTTINMGSPTMDVSIEQYRIDGNFTDLWGQLLSAKDDFLAQLENAAGEAYEHAYEQLDNIKNMADRVSQQQDMLAYMGKVNDYNKRSFEKLTKLGNLLNLYDDVKNKSTADRNAYLTSSEVGYNASFNKLEDDIKTTWYDLVSLYNSELDGQKPTNLYADPRITYPVYKPIVEFCISDKQATSSTFSGDNGVSAICNAMANDQDGIGKVLVNMIIDKSAVLDSTPSVYRMVDWSAYGGEYWKNLNQYADIYCSDSVINSLSAKDKSQVLLYNPSIANLAYGSIKKEDNSSKWNEQGGIRFFVKPFAEVNVLKDEFFKHSTDGGVQNTYQLKNNGWWASDGIHVDGNLYEALYEGTTQYGTFAEYNSRFSSSSTGTVTPAGSKVRTSSANISNLKAQSVSDLNEIHTLTTSKADSELTNKFAKNIVTFRKLNAAGADSDVSALRDWIKTKQTTTPLSEHTETMLYDLTADDVDDLMTSSTSKMRNYLLLTQDGAIDASDTNNWGDYVGRVSWSNWKTVKAFYEIPEMNFAMGFIAIVTAIGVYMNFVFGLIQRAVNMSVLYIMSPVTIAFYPFDNGQRFKSSFVQPFYKEAISAYAVIISLNLFIVLMNPVASAASTAVGGGVTGALVSFLALVAFTSMLPKIRDSICSLLGANSMQSQSLTDTFKNASKSLGSAVGDFRNLGKAGKNVAKKTAHAADFLAKTKANRDARRADNQNRELADLQNKQKNGEKLSKWEQHRLNRLTNGAEAKKQAEARAAASDQKINEARDAKSRLAELNGKKKLTKAEQAEKAAAEEKLKALNFREARRLNRQDKKLQAAAEKAVGPKGSRESQKAYNARIKAEKEKLKADKNFMKEAGRNLVSKGFSKTAQFAAKGGQLVAAPVKALGGALGGAGSWVANSSVGGMVKTFGSKISNSMLGQAVTDKYGRFGSLSENKDSFIGSMYRLTRPDIVEKRHAEAGSKYRNQQQILNKANAKAYEGSKKLADAIVNKNKMVKNAATRMAAEAAVAEGQMTTQEKLFALKKAEFIRDGVKDEAEATAKTKQYFKEEALKQNKNTYINEQTKYLQKQGKSADEAQKEAEKNYNDIMKFDNTGAELEKAIRKNFKNANVVTDINDAAFINAEYAKMGGDAKLAEGLAKGLKEFTNLGINFNIDKPETQSKIAAAEKEFNAIVAKGSAKLELDLKAKTEKRNENLKDSAEALAKKLGFTEAKDISAVKDVLDKADSHTSFEDLVSQVASKMHVGIADVKKNFAPDYEEFSKNVQFNNEVKEAQEALDAAKIFEKGKSEFRSKMGDNISDEDQNKIISSFTSIYDADRNSSNKESLGYKQREIVEKFKAMGKSEDDPECQAALNRIANQMNTAATEQFNTFVEKYRNEIIRHEVQQKASQELNAVYSMSMLEDAQKQIEVNASVNLDVPAINVLYKDNMLQAMKENGDYAGAANQVKVAVDAVMRHDYEALDNVQLSQDTIEKLKQWESEGGQGLKRLEGIAKYHEFISTQMGTTNADMGGHTLQGMGSVMKELYALNEQKIWLGQIQATTKNWGEEEGHNRAIVNTMMNKINSFGEEWNELYGKITDMKGHAVNSIEELQAAMRETLDFCNKDINNEQIENNLKALRGMRAEAIRRQDVNTANMVEDFLNSITAANTANMLEGQTQSGRNMASAIQSRIVEYMDKVKPFSGNK